MAIGKASDMVIYQAEFQSGLVEGLNQNVALFNESTRGAIRLIPAALKGHYGKAAFFQDVASLVTRRDITSTSTVTDLAMTQDENVSVKLNRKIGPVAQTLDAIKKAGLTEAQASFAFGQLAASRKMKDMVNTALIAAEAAIQGNTAMNLDVTGESVKTASTAYLVQTLAKMGDMAGDIVCWIGHSKPYYDILNGMISDKVTGLADIVTIQGGIPATLGRGFVITDAGALTDANGSATDTYNTLGLVSGAVVVEESEVDTFATELVTGIENIARRWQSEYAYNVSVKGFKWDIGNGGVNPTNGNLGTTSNWDQVAYDDKLTAGVRLLSQ